MIKIKKSLVLALLLIFAISLVEGKDIKKVGQTGLQFLKVDVGARAAAMGGAYSMVGQDATAMFHNPAGISEMKQNFDITTSQSQWIADITYSSIGIVKNLENFGAIGLTATSSDYGKIQGTVVADNEQGYRETGNVETGAYAIGINYGRQLIERFFIGGQVKYAAQHLGSSKYGGKSHTNKVSGLVFDFGTIYYTGLKDHKIGMTIRNFSRQFEYEEYSFNLPLTFTIGTSIDVMKFVPNHSNPLTISFDAIHPRDYYERMQLGAEYIWGDILALRAGYKFNYTQQGLNLGVGLNPEISGLDLKVDYSFSQMGVFNPVHRFSIGITY